MPLTWAAASIRAECDDIERVCGVGRAWPVIRSAVKRLRALADAVEEQATQATA
jgi:hypothetical protein